MAENQRALKMNERVQRYLKDIDSGDQVSLTSTFCWII